VFKEHPKALGVQGLIENNPKRQSFSQFLNRIFRLSRLTTNNSCNFLEYPSELSATVNCQNLVGSNMTYRRKVFSEFKFDSNLKKYSYMEDALFSHSIFKKYPTQLFITPQAKCIHKVSKAGRLDNKELEPLKNKQRKYVLQELFGKKGLFLYYWQTLGLKIKATGKNSWQALTVPTLAVTENALQDQKADYDVGFSGCDYGYMEDEIRGS
jgi:hypothetical protein